MIRLLINKHLISILYSGRQTATLSLSWFDNDYFRDFFHKKWGFLMQLQKNKDLNGKSPTIFPLILI